MRQRDPAAAQGSGGERGDGRRADALELVQADRRARPAAERRRTLHRAFSRRGRRLAADLERSEQPASQCGWRCFRARPPPIARSSTIAAATRAASSQVYAELTGRYSVAANSQAAQTMLAAGGAQPTTPQPAHARPAPTCSPRRRCAGRPGQRVPLMTSSKRRCRKPRAARSVSPSAIRAFIRCSRRANAASRWPPRCANCGRTAARRRRRDHRRCAAEAATDAAQGRPQPLDLFSDRTRRVQQLTLAVTRSAAVNETSTIPKIYGERFVKRRPLE